MNKFLVLGTALAISSFFIACGGGDSGTEKAAKSENPANKTASSSGYSSITVSDGGTIKGHVSFGGAIPPKQKLEVTKDVSVCGKVAHYNQAVVVSDQGGLANVMVKITNIAAGKSMDTAAGEVVLNQTGCAFKPHVTLLHVGQPCTILNSDGILHNIHTFSEINKPVNHAQPGFKKKMSQTFDKAEIIRIACDVHNWMGGYIVVADNPYYAITDADGNFELADVPAGSYTLEYWQESLGTQTKEVAVAAGASVEADAEFTTGS